MDAEKILNHLVGMEARINERFEKVETEIGELKKEQAEFKKEQTKTNHRLSNLEADVAVLKVNVAKLTDDVAELKKQADYAVQRAESASESIAVIEVEHGRTLGAIFDYLSLVHDKAVEHVELASSVRKKQDEQDIILAWHDTRLKKAAV